MKLTDREWKPVLIASYFSFIRGRENNMALLETGDIPLISAKNGNNGLKGFVSTSKSVVQGNCITLNNDGDGGAGLAYYQPTDMALDTHVTALIPKVEISMFTLLFISKCLSKLHGFFGHGLSISNERAVKIRIMLPTTSTGEPDFKFMEDYTKELIQKKKKQYRAYIENMVYDIDFNINVSAVKWAEFFLEDLFTVSPGKRLTNADKIEGKRPFIGATDNNNGITGFVDNENTSLDRNVLGVNYNGAPCIGFYHPYECIFTDDVKRLHLKKYPDNPYVFLFMKAVILKQRSKYSYGYKFNENRMLRQLLSVPVTDSGEPDYAFMEQYGKMLVARKYKQYLDYLDSQKTK